MSDTSDNGSPVAIEIPIDPELAERLQDAGELAELLDFRDAQPEAARDYLHNAYTDEDWREHQVLYPDPPAGEDMCPDAPPEIAERRRRLRQRVKQRWQRHLARSRQPKRMQRRPARREPRPARQTSRRSTGTSASGQDPGDDGDDGGDSDPDPVKIRQVVAQLVQSRPLTDADRAKVVRILRGVGAR